jgi:hypothetical protein
MIMMMIVMIIMIMIMMMIVVIMALLINKGLNMDYCTMLWFDVIIRPDDDVYMYPPF